MVDRNGSRTLPERVGLREFRAHMTDFLEQARQGRSFAITSRGEVMAEIRPPSREERPRRQPGALRGRIRMADDFDALPPDILSAMQDDVG